MSEKSKLKTLEECRQQIDILDEKLVEILAKRMKLVVNVGEIKRKQKVVPLDPSRWQQVVDSRRAMAVSNKLSPDFVEEILDLIHEHALVLEKNV